MSILFYFTESDGITGARGQGARTDKDNEVAIQPVNQQKIAADVSIPVINPAPISA